MVEAADAMLGDVKVGVVKTLEDGTKIQENFDGTKASPGTAVQPCMCMRMAPIRGAEWRGGRFRPM